MSLLSNHYSPVRIVGALGLLLFAFHATESKADYSVMGFDALMFQKAGGGFQYGAMSDEPRLGSGGSTLPGILLNDGLSSFEIDAQIIDQIGDPFDLTVFGGVGGSYWKGTDDFGANFDPADYRLEVNFKPGAKNDAVRFDIALDQHDGFSNSPTNTLSQGEQYNWYFDDFVNKYDAEVLAGKADPQGFVTLTRDITRLPNPVTNSLTDSWDYRNATASGFSGSGDGLLDFDAIEDGARNGISTLSLKSVFGSSDRLNINIKSIKLVPKVEVTEAARIDANSAFTSDFGSAELPGAVDRTGSSLVVDFDGEAGGVSLNNVLTSFDGNQYGIEVKAKILGDNAAASFNVVAKELDGDDDAAGEGAEEWLITVDTADFNETDFATITIPWSDASNNPMAFGFTNEGDGSIDDFDLFQLQLSGGSDTSRLNIELESIKVVPIVSAGLSGDFNNDGTVDAADYTLWRDNLGNGDETAINSNGDGGDISSSDYDLWVANYGNSSTTSASNAVPEPSSLLIAFVACGCGIFKRRVEKS